MSERYANRTDWTVDDWQDECEMLARSLLRCSQQHTLAQHKVKELQIDKQYLQTLLNRLADEACKNELHGGHELILKAPEMAGATRFILHPIQEYQVRLDQEDS
jgi:hypothetical protein